MFSINHYYRDFKNDSRLIFQEVEPKKIKSAAELWKKEGREGLGIFREGMAPEEVRSALQENYGPARYEAVIQEYVERHLKDTDADQKNLFIKHSVERYKLVFDGERGIFASFDKAIKNLKKAHDRAIDQIKDTTHHELGVLHDRIDAARKTHEAKPKIGEIPSPAVEQGTVPIVNPALGKVPLIGPLFKSVNIPVWSRVVHSPEWIAYKQAEEKIQKETLNYLEKFLENYMTPGLYDSDLGEKIRVGFIMQAEGGIRFLFDQGKATQASLKDFVEKLTNKIKEYCGYDGEPGNLSVKDAAILQHQAAPLTRLAEVINTGSEESLLEAMEKERMLHPEGWAERVQKIAEALMADAVRNGNDRILIEKVNTYLKQKNLEWAQKMGVSSDKAPFNTPVKNFEEAQKIFENALSVSAGGGVRETVALFSEFNQALNEGKATLFKSVSPSSMETLVYREYRQLLDDLTVPEDTYQKAVVEFIQAGTRKDREAILKNPQKRAVLFTAIRIIEKDTEGGYVDYYNKNAAHLPNDLNKLKSNPDASDPTKEDKLARAKALIIMAGEARWITENFSNTKDFKDRGWMAELDNIQLEETPYQPNVNFRDVNKLHNLSYVSIAARGGFTGKELALDALKIFAGVTAIANVGEALRGGLKEETVEALIGNPFLWGGLGTIYAINRYREDPSITGILTASPGRRNEHMTRVSLTSLSKKIGATELRRFIGIESEWPVMQLVSKEPEKVKELIKKAKERDRENPKITKEDLKEFAPDKFMHLPAETNDRNRFYFYSKFLTGPKNILELHEHCLKWS